MVNDAATKAREASLRYPGWLVVLAAFFGVMVSFAAVVPFTFSLFLTPLHMAFGWERQAISIAFGIAAMTVAACSPGIGYLLDRHPPRAIILPSIAVFSAGIFSLGFLQRHIAQFYLSYFIIGVVGNGTAQLAYSRALSTWFVARRGLAFALMLTGSGVGSIALPLLVQYVIESRGWRAAYFALGILAFAVALPLTALFARERPSHPAFAEQSGADGMSVGQAMRSRIFWYLMASILLYALSANGAIAHLSAILTSHNVRPHAAAVALSVLGASGIAGRLVTGSLLDRCFAPRVSMCMLLLCVASLMLLAYTHSAAAGITASALLGFGLGSEADVTPYLIARYCGVRNFSTLYGLSWTAYAIGGAIGPVLTGRAFDRAGTYSAGFITLLAMPCLISALLTLGMPRYGKVWNEEMGADLLEQVS